MTEANIVRVYEDSETLYRAAAELTTAHLKAAIGERGRALVALSGGSLTSRLYPLLANPPLRDQIDWPTLSVLFADERYVPFDHPDNTCRATHQSLLDHVPVVAEQIFPVATYYRDPEQAAAIYQQQTAALLQAHNGHLDVALLGMGPDGHTASLFPRHPALLTATDELVIVVRDAPKPPPLRISLTPTALNTARLVVFVVSGADKAAAVAAALAERGDPLDHPTRAIHPPAGRVCWLLDRAGASAIDA